MELLYAAGVRVSELVGLDTADVALRDGQLRVLGKGRKERVVLIGQAGPPRSGRLPAGGPAPAGRRRRVRALPQPQGGPPVGARGGGAGP